MSPGILLLAVLLLLSHFVLAVLSKRVASTTADELFHLTAGVSYWKFNDYRLHPENGNLPQRWAALPAWLNGTRFPDVADNEYWRSADMGVVGHQFFYETGEDHFPKLMAGRAMIAVLSVLLGVSIFFWSRHLFGPWGALLSLGLFAFSPNFLAHGALVTSDVCMTLFFVTSVWAWWHHLHRPTVATFLVSALSIGLAFVSKFSALLLIPMMVAMGVVRAMARAPLAVGRTQLVTVSGKLLFATLSGIGHALIVAAVIWTFYGFRYSAFHPDMAAGANFIRPWETYVGHTGVLGEIARTLGRMRVLPEAFLYGLDHVLLSTASRAAYLNGEYSLTGWRTFFLWTFALKSTPATLIATAAVAVATVRTVFKHALQWRALYRFVPLIVLFVVYGTSSILSRVNIGHRHILPLYPVLFIAAGALATPFGQRPRLRVGMLAALLGWHAFEGARITPHHLAYFNFLAGGPDNGRYYLVDSSLDWGQDLPSLKKWLDEHAGDEPVFLSYFGSGEPLYYGIKAKRIAFLNNFNFGATYVRLTPGIYCISATILMQVYTDHWGPWTEEREHEYQLLRQFEPMFAGEREFSGIPSDKIHVGIKRHDSLRMSRLAAYLRLRKPDADIGSSILIYRLTAEEIERATESSLHEWLELLQETTDRSKHRPAE